jgi:hypothetical protein
MTAMNRTGEISPGQNVLGRSGRSSHPSEEPADEKALELISGNASTGNTQESRSLGHHRQYHLLSSSIPLRPNVFRGNPAGNGTVCRHIHKRVIATNENELRRYWKALQNIGDHRIVDTTSAVARLPRGLSGEREDEFDPLSRQSISSNSSKSITRSNPQCIGCGK